MSIALVVLGHVLVFNVVFFSNPLEVIQDSESSGPALVFTIAALGFRAVDTFFFLGALLFAFVVVRKCDSSMSFLSFKAGIFLVVSRLLRVIPLYYFVLFVW
jgi:hypothetical protein